MVAESENLLTRLGSPKYVLAPMVEASELAWRMLARQYGAELTYTPMIHALMFVKDKSYRTSSLQQFCDKDRPLIVQFCANNADTFVQASLQVQPFCDAVDLNLGCPQGIARRGHYGAFLQDEWELISQIEMTSSTHTCLVLSTSPSKQTLLVRQAKDKLKVPVTCKIRVFPDVEHTVQYAKMVEAAGASMITVHGRTRQMKGQLTGLADWSQIKRVKEAVRVPVVANGNIQYFDDIARCLLETNVDGVMSAEGHLHNPALFANLQPSIFTMCFEYLDYAEIYPTSASIVRGHLFKVCQHALTEHPEIRQLLLKPLSVAEFRSVIKQMQTTCSSCKSNSDKSLPYPHWICQPYVRKLPTDGDVKTAEVVNGDAAEETEPIDAADINRLAIQEARRLRREAKRIAKLSKSETAVWQKAICEHCKTNFKYINMRKNAAYRDIGQEKD